MPDKYKITDHVTFRQTSSDLKMLFDRDKGVMYELNETASAVVELIAGGVDTVDGISQSLAEQFDADPSEIQEDVNYFLSEFVQANIVAAQ